MTCESKTVTIDADSQFGILKAQVEENTENLEQITDDVESAQAVASSAQTSASAAVQLANAANQNVAAAINGKADTSVTDDLQDQIDSANSSISEKSDQTDLDNLQSQVSQNTSSIQLRATKAELIALSSEVETKADQSSLDSANSAISQNSDDIDSLNSALQLRATKTEVNALSATVANKADQSALDTTNGEVSALANQVGQNAIDIQSKANQSALDSLSSQVADKAEQADLDDAVFRISQNEQDIASKASSSSVASLQSDVDELQLSKADQSDLDSALSRITQNEQDIANLPTDLNLEEINDSIAENASNIALKANQSDLDATNSNLATKASQSDLDSLSSDVEGKANQSDLDSLSLTTDQNTNSINSINDILTKYDSWSSLSGPLNKGSIVNHNNIDWLLKVNLTDATTSEPSYLNSDYKDLLSELKSVAIALNTSVNNVAFLQAGVSLAAEILRDAASELTLIAWDTLTTPYVITSYAANNYAGYDVVTDRGTFEFVTPEILKLRNTGNAEGWGCDIDFTDNSTQLNAYAQAAIEFGFDFKTEKPYKVADTLVIPRNVKVEMSVPLDFTSATTFSGSVAVNVGEESLTQLTSVLNSDPEIYTNIISVTDGSEFSVGDVISIFNPTDYSFHAERDYYRDGELVQVHEINANDLTLTKPLRSSYTAADMELWKFDTPNNAELDIKVKCSDAALFAVLLNMSVDSRIKLSVYGGNAGAVDRNMCFDCDYDIGRVEQTSANTTLAYGLCNRNSSYQRDHGGSVEAARHAVTNTGRDGTARPPCRGNRSLSQSLSNHPEETNTSAWDCHAVAEDCLAIDCDIYGGVVVGGANNGAPNCRIYQIEGRVCFLEGSIVNTNHNFSGCDVYLTNVVSANAALATFGYTTDRLGVNLKAGGLLDFSSITIITTATDNATLKSLVNITVNDYAGADIDVTFKGLRVLIDGDVVNTNLIQLLSAGTYWIRGVTLSSLESRGVAYLIECDNLLIDSMVITETDQTSTNVQALSATIHKSVDVADYKCSNSKFQGLALTAGSSGATCNIGVARVNNCNQVTSTNSRVRSGVSIEEFDKVVVGGIHAHTDSGLANSYPYYIRNCNDVHIGINSYSGYDLAPQNDNNTTVTTMNLGFPV